MVGLEVDRVGVWGRAQLEGFYLCVCIPAAKEVCLGGG